MSKNLGNPILAAKLASDPALRKDVKDTAINITNKVGSFVKTAFIVGGVGVGLVAIKKQMDKAKKRKWLKAAANDPDITTAMQMWEEIPQRYKPTGNLINPLNLLDKVWGEIKVWETSNDKRMLEYGSQIIKLATIEKVFSELYSANVYEILSQTMTPANYQEFLNRAKRDKTPYEKVITANVGKVVVPNRSTTVYRKVFFPNASWDKLIQFQTYPVTTKMNIGVATGKLFHKDGADYIESVVTGKTKYAFYTLQTDAKLMAQSEFAKIQDSHPGIAKIILLQNEQSVTI
ncbi:MAG: hypothetical protein WC707_06960 [Candidatus Babeliaceae bacterium]|jgi:hypothetical protein